VRTVGSSGPAEPPDRLSYADLVSDAQGGGAHPFPRRFLVEFLWFLIGLVIAIIFAVICYRIAVGKGHNGTLWAVLGFLFTLIALIILLILPRRTPPPAAA
jgi:hypothetical protein